MIPCCCNLIWALKSLGNKKGSSLVNFAEIFWSGEQGISPVLCASNLFSFRNAPLAVARCSCSTQRLTVAGHPTEPPDDNNGFEEGANGLWRSVTATDWERNGLRLPSGKSVAVIYVFPPSPFTIHNF